MTFLLIGARIFRWPRTQDARAVTGYATGAKCALSSGVADLSKPLAWAKHAWRCRISRNCASEPAGSHRVRGLCDVFARVLVIHGGTVTGWVTLITERSGNPNGRPSNQGRTGRHGRPPRVDALRSPRRCGDPGLLPAAQRRRGASHPADGCERIRGCSRALESTAHQPVESPGLECTGCGNDVVDPRQRPLLPVSAHHRARASVPGSGGHPVVADVS